MKSQSLHSLSLPKTSFDKTRKRVLFICGTYNQTTQMHQVASQLPEYEAAFSPYYGDGFLDFAKEAGMLEWTILGNKWVKRSSDYLRTYSLPIDYRGKKHAYDLVVTCQDLIIPKNIRRSKMVLVQEGMTDPETSLFRLVRALPFLPRWFAGTSTTGLSNRYDRFCVASDGYRDLFVQKGVRPEKIEVTGIPNFDNCRKFLINDFPHKHFVLVCTSDSRETFAYENRKKFIEKAVQIAAGRQLIFKLHPNEDVRRATREINRYAPCAIVCENGKAEEMVANCDVLVTRYSTTAYVGIALGKEVYSEFNLEQLKRLLPLQNGSAASNIANVCRELLEQKVGSSVPVRSRSVGSFCNPDDFRATSKSLTTEVER